MIKKGDKVEVEGAVASVESIWAQGRHMAYNLDDGRTVLDLEGLITLGKAKLIVAAVPSKPLRSPPQRIDTKKLIAEDSE